MEEQSKILSKKNILLVTSSNLLTLLTAVAIGLIMPKFVSFETYAGYRTYTLYMGYVVIFHLGIVNGVALRFGEKSYDALPTDRFRLYTRSLALLELFFQIMMFLAYIGYCSMNGQGIRLTPIVFVIINIFQSNLRHYLSTIDRFSGRFDVDAALNVLYDFAQLITLVILLAKGIDDVTVYLGFITLLNFLLLVMYLFANRQIVVGKITSGSSSLSDVILNVKRGSYVMTGELMGSLILGIDSIFAQLFFDDKSFSQYTFAVYIIVAAYTLMSTVDSLIFPYLKRLDKRNIKKSYSKLKLATFAVSGIMYAAILLARPLIPMLLPNYSESMKYLGILGITVVFRAVIGLACGNFMRAMDMEKEYFRNNIFALVLAVVLDTIVYLAYRNLIYIAEVSVLVYALWFVMNDVTILRSVKKGEISE